MRETQGTWGEVQVDGYIRDRAGVVWRVCAADPTAGGPTTSPAFRCKNRLGEWMTVSPKPKDAPVTRLVPTEADAIPLLRDALGATVVASKPNDQEEWTCEAWGDKAQGRALDDYRYHLEHLHGVYAGDIKTYAKLREAHDTAHDPSRTTFGKRTPHNHSLT